LYRDDCGIRKKESSFLPSRSPAVSRPPSLPPYLPIRGLDIHALVGIARALAMTDEDDAVGLGDLVGGRALNGRERGREEGSVRWRVVEWWSSSFCICAFCLIV